MKEYNGFKRGDVVSMIPSDELGQAWPRVKGTLEALYTEDEKVIALVGVQGDGVYSGSADTLDK